MHAAPEEQLNANALRKAGDYNKAIPLYKKQWQSSCDAYDGAGLLHCLRKSQQFDEAIPFADELIEKHPKNEWCCLEFIWTYIQGKLNKLSDDVEMGPLIELCDRIMRFEPKEVARKMVVFKVLKRAKDLKQWEIINEWAIKLEPEELSAAPMHDKAGRDGWCDQGLWYNVRVRGLVETGNESDALALLEEVGGRFPKQQKFFLRLKGLAYVKLDDFEKAKPIYEELYNKYRPDWWLIHEYAKVLRETNDAVNAFSLMCQAANVKTKLETKVSLIEDIGMLCKNIEDFKLARDHFLLSKYIREEQGWNISDDLNASIASTTKMVSSSAPETLKNALSNCRNEWQKHISQEKVHHSKFQGKRVAKKRLSGKVNLGPTDRPFCFILDTNKESYFCYKSDLPDNITNGDNVKFDAVPSFDKKKQKESWKAANIINA